MSYNGYTPARARAFKKWRDKLRLEILAAYGNKCECCGASEPDFLAVDHIEPDSSSGLTSVALWRHLKKLGFPRDNFRLLCHSCNGARSWGRNCPHEAMRLLTGGVGSGT